MLILSPFVSLFGFLVAAAALVVVIDVVDTCQMSKLQYHFTFLRFDTFVYQIMKKSSYFQVDFGVKVIQPYIT